MTETDNSLHGTGQFRLHYTNTNDAAQALLGPAYSFGNEAKITASLETEREAVRRNLRGLNRQVGNPVTTHKIAYEIESSQLTFNALAIALFMEHTLGSDTARTAASDVTITTFDFRTSQGKTHNQSRWYDLIHQTTFARYLHVTSVTLTGALLVYGAAADSATLLEGKDYELDKTMGAVRFLRAIDDNIITTVTYGAIAAGDGVYARTQTPLAKNKLSGIGAIQIFDDAGKLILKHEGFGCDVIPNGDIEFNSRLSTVKLKVNASLPTGNILVSQD